MCGGMEIKHTNSCGNTGLAVKNILDKQAELASAEQIIFPALIS
jgi:hypothetical protein